MEQQMKRHRYTYAHKKQQNPSFGGLQALWVILQIAIAHRIHDEPMMVQKQKCQLNRVSASLSQDNITKIKKVTPKYLKLRCDVEYYKQIVFHQRTYTVQKKRVLCKSQRVLFHNHLMTKITSL